MRHGEIEKSYAAANILDSPILSLVYRLKMSRLVGLINLIRGAAMGENRSVVGYIFLQLSV